MKDLEKKLKSERNPCLAVPHLFDNLFPREYYSAAVPKRSIFMATDGPFRPTPEENALRQEPIRIISKYGWRALSIIYSAQRRMEHVVHPHLTVGERELYFMRHNNISLRINEPFSPLLDFGNLADPEEPCKITLSALSQGPGSSGRDLPLSQGEQILFGKDMALDLLSKVKPGETAETEGKGKHRIYSETPTCLDEEILTDPRVNFNRISSAPLALELALSRNFREVIFSFRMEDMHTFRELTYKKRGILGIPRFVSSTWRLDRSKN